MARTASVKLLVLLPVLVISITAANSEQIGLVTRIRRQSDFLDQPKKHRSGSRNEGGGSSYGYPSPYGGGGNPPVPNYSNYPPPSPYNHGYPQYNPYQMYFPPTQYNPQAGNVPPGNININIPPQAAPQPVSVPNINNVIYGPSPPSNVNNNFYGPTLSAPAEEKKEKFCNANTEFNCYNGNCLTNPHQLCDGKNDCGNRVDELNCNHLNYQIRLRSENDESDTQAQYANQFIAPSSSYSHVATRNEGIIEVSVKGQRGCVCNRNFDIHDADVACRELGFRKGCDKINRVSRTKASELYSDGVPYLMDNINCIGNETSVRECDFDGWGRTDRSCGRRNIVSISCKTDYPSAPVPPATSRFNMYDDVEINLPTPQRPFDYDPPAAPPQVQPQVTSTPAPQPLPQSANTGFSVFSRNSSTIFHRDETQIVEGSTGNCAGQQFACKSNQKCIPIDRICDRYADCEDNSDETFEGCNQPVQIRLMNGQAVSEGRLEIRVHGIWGTVCGQSFGVNEAGVFCRTLGFLGQPQILKNSTAGEGKGPIWLDNLACPSDETCCLTSCYNLIWGRSSCSHSQDVALRCSNLLRLN